MGYGFFMLAAGLGLLVVAAEMVVRGAARLAASLGVGPLILGLTVVAIGTSAPELAVGITASLQGSGSLAVGNIAGTNMFNILFILGLTAMVRALPIHLQVLKLELPTMVLAAALMTAFSLDGVISRLDGAIMLGAAVLYTVLLIRISRRESPEVKHEFSDMYGNDRGPGGQRAVLGKRMGHSAVLAAGLVLSVIGADWLVSGAIDIAREFDISEAVIGLTIVAIGTSAPELVTTIVATLRDERDVAVGNLLGSSIYNILVILGLTCLVTPGGIPVEPRLMLVDIPLMAGVALICIPVFITGKSISRLEGGLGVSIYVAYMAWLLFART